MQSQRRATIKPAENQKKIKQKPRKRSPASRHTGFSLIQRRQLDLANVYAYWVAAAFGPKAKENRTRNRNMGEAHERMNTNTYTHWAKNPKSGTTRDKHARTLAAILVRILVLGHPRGPKRRDCGCNQAAKWLQLTG